MIEKLKETYTETTRGKITQKINELVDAVNNQQIQLNNHECRLLDLQNRITALDDPTYHEVEPKPADPHAEQRKWVGCLCWFWESDPNDKIVDVLSHIDTARLCPFIQCDHQIGWTNCEPVKPDDDIIYKGGDNE